MEAATESLRKAAPNWTLDGDKQLLGMLQQIHQSIMTKCQEANTKLDAMVDALDTASIDLQNVNNKFMALSNSQFVESRVYDDDVDIKSEEDTTKKQEIPQVVPESDLQKVKRCLQQLEMMHEPVLILDSDSSDDEESSMVLKPKDIYAHRPLPHIIGSQAWKNKWHAGLLPEDSDSDNDSSSKRDEEEQYSDSEPEVAVDVTDKQAQRTISSSSMESEVLSRSSQPVASPAEVAAELARRLAGPPKAPAAEPQTMLPPEPIRKVYGIDKPLPATVFPTEPPPLDTYDSDKYSEDDDIFAELHRKPHQNSYRDTQKSNFANNIVDELFGDSAEIGNVVPDYVQDNDTRDDSPLFDDVSSSNKDKHTNEQTPSTDTNIKKPVGGISLFGSNKGAESIGAAILKRNQRKSSSDEDANDETQTKPMIQPEKDNKKIIEDLFTKPTVKKKDTVKKISEKIDNVKPIDKVDSVKPKESKVDLFSDNLFDDIDDIFTTNVTKPKNDKNTKSIFDDDDLFADIIETDKLKDKKDKKNAKSIFDSDDDLFNDNDKNITANENQTISKLNASTLETSNIKPKTFTSQEVSKTENKKVKSIFDDDSDDDLFSDIKVIKSDSKNELIKGKDIKVVDHKTESNILSGDNLFSNSSNSNVNKNIISSKLNTVSKQLQSPNLFDDEDDDDDLFGVNTEQNVKSILKTPQSSESKNNFNSGEKDELYNNVDTNVEKNKNDTNKESKNISDFEEKDEIHNSFDTNMEKNKSDTNNSINESSNSEEIPETLRQNIISDVKESTQTIPSTSNDKNLDENNTKINVKEDEIILQENNEDLHEKEVKTTENREATIELNKDATKDIDITEPGALFSEQIVPESSEPDIFNDIFNSVPPAFEKPNESKKSKNVNALFDDDSDDESLFFKKNDVISDEKPDLDYSSDRFKIFHDEPPDIDVDFSQKPLKTTNISNEKHIDDLFNEMPTMINEIKEKAAPEKKDSKLHENEPVKTIDITKLLEENSKKQEVNISLLLEEERDEFDSDGTNYTKTETKVEKTIHNIEHNKSEENENRDTQISEEDSTKKSIGKIKPVNLNINVHTLLPGASPKKSKTNEEMDGQILSTDNDFIKDYPNTETKMVKSVSFEGDPDSKVLDNKLSKERAKIQVKRRPSTRRARLEAVRKSGMDFRSDSTDNSSSLEEPKPKITEDRTNSPVTPDISIKDTENIDSEKLHAHIDNTIVHKTKTDFVSKTEQKPEVISKVVYILHDEDIFSNTAQNIPEIDNLSNNNTENAKEINFKNETSRDKDIKVETKDRKPLFDDLSDEELFGKKPVQKVKDKLFDSDSDEELFSKKEKGIKQKKELARVSLFDDDSDDDLFSSKTSKVSEIKPGPKQNRSTNKPTETVFEDPLSMLGDDES